ncbi:MAG: hypothetical protein L6V82_07310 [Clostridiales bacterium]|nr:MAG: hypothetical protein L6V82_07310 [Clostridiales bacterium]
MKKNRELKEKLVARIEDLK